MAWNSWDKGWGKKSRSPNNQNGEGKDKDKEKDKKGRDQAKFPSYDAGNAQQSSSASSASSLAITSPEVVQLLRTIAAKDESLAPPVESLLPDPLKEDIREKQKIINTVRKLQQKIERKEQAIARKEGQMAQFLEDIKQHILQEKARHRNDMEQLHKELEETQLALKNLQEGKATNTEMTGNEELETLLDMEDVTNKENVELKKKIQQMEKDKTETQQQMYAMQMQMENFMKHYADTVKDTPAMTTPPALTPQVIEVDGTKKSLNAESPIRSTAAALQPFRVGRERQPRLSPYSAAPKGTNSTMKEAEDCRDFNGME